MSHVWNAARILLATLREIFDEAAYERFLGRTRMASSPAAYAAFWRDRDSNQAPTTRCC